MNKLKDIAQIIIIISALGAVWVIKADADRVHQLEIRVENKINQDRYNAIQERIWALQDRLELFEPNHEARKAMIEEIRKLKLELEELDKKLN